MLRRTRIRGPITLWGVRYLFPEPEFSVDALSLFCQRVGRLQNSTEADTVFLRLLPKYKNFFYVTSRRFEGGSGGLPACLPLRRASKHSVQRASLERLVCCACWVWITAELQVLLGAFSGSQLLCHSTDALALTLALLLVWLAYCYA
jgi:hypothetical protein